MRRSHRRHSGSSDTLTVSRNADQFDIIHISKHTGRQIVYSFLNDFLPPTTIRHVDTLGIFPREEVTYMLNSMDNKAIVEVLYKLRRERRSRYIFSDLLQKTYLIEFIHLITKIHFRSAV